MKRDILLMQIIRNKKLLVDANDHNPGQVIPYAVDDFATTPSKTLFTDFTITSKYKALLKKVENGGYLIKTRPPPSFAGLPASEGKPTPPSHFALRASRDKWQGEGSHPTLTTHPKDSLHFPFPTPSKTPLSHTPNRLPVGSFEVLRLRSGSGLPPFTTHPRLTSLSNSHPPPKTPLTSHPSPPPYPLLRKEGETSLLPQQQNRVIADSVLLIFLLKRWVAYIQSKAR